MNMDHVLAQLEGASKEVRGLFFELVKALRIHPYPSERPNEHPYVLPFKGRSQPNCFTAPFDDGLLAYQIKADQPLIDPLHIVWL